MIGTNSELGEPFENMMGANSELGEPFENMMRT
jgi:hypothetical protein